MDGGDRAAAHAQLHPPPRHDILAAESAQPPVGPLVEAVSDILTVTDDMVQPTPDVASELAKTFLRGVMTIDDRMVSLLALDRVLPTAAPDIAA